MREAEVDRAFKAALRRRGIDTLWRNPQPNPRRAKWGEVGCGGSGSADWIGCVNGRFIAVELKGEGGRPKPHQLDWGMAVVKAGGVYLLCEPCNIEQVVDFIFKIKHEKTSIMDLELREKGIAV